MLTFDDVTNIEVLPTCLMSVGLFVIKGGGSLGKISVIATRTHVVERHDGDGGMFRERTFAEARIPKNCRLSQVELRAQGEK